MIWHLFYGSRGWEAVREDGFKAVCEVLDVTAEVPTMAPLFADRGDEVHVHLDCSPTSCCEIYTYRDGRWVPAKTVTVPEEVLKGFKRLREAVNAVRKENDIEPVTLQELLLISLEADLEEALTEWVS